MTKRDGIVVQGHVGTWYVVAEKEYEGFGMLYLLEHECYGGDAPWVCINEEGKLIVEDIYNGFDDVDYCIEEDLLKDYDMEDN